jgi:pSer/pThr/pTyr-binding forkhead associated (FHA) protein
MTPPPTDPGDCGPTLSAAATDTAEVRQRIDVFGRLLEALPEPPAGPALLYQIEGRDEVRSVPLGAELIVGRRPEASECGLAFPECERMSRRHFRIRRVEDFHVLTDLGSANGTYVNASPARIREHWLTAGDILFAGGVVFAFSGD